MVEWMTTSENRVLDTAIRNGYLVCRRDQRTLLDQYASLCSERCLPVLRVERQVQSQVVLQWHQGIEPLSESEQQQLRELLCSPDQKNSLLPIVFRFGAYSACMPLDAAERLASRLASWCQERTFSR